MSGFSSQVNLFNKMKEKIIKGKVIDDIADNLAKVGKVKATGLGKFKVVSMKARKAYNIAKGKSVLRKSYKKIKFTPTKKLRDLINK